MNGTRIQTAYRARLSSWFATALIASILLLPGSLMAQGTTGTPSVSVDGIKYLMDNAAGTATVVACDETTTGEVSILPSVNAPTGNKTFPVVAIGDNAFSGCKQITKVIIPEGVTSIGHRAFSGCSALQSVSLPKGLLSIGDATFEACRALTELVLPEGITSIGQWAFFACYSIPSINLPESITDIGRQAFERCISLKLISIPSKITEWNSLGLSTCSSLAKIDVANGNTHLSSSDGIIYDKDAKVLEFCPRGRKGEVAIPEGVTEIGNWAFDNCMKVTAINLPESLKTIGESAFSNCMALTAITLPAKLTEIGDNAFDQCHSLTQVSLPEELTRIGLGAFASCPALTSVVIPSKVTTIGESAFWCCGALARISIPEGLKEIEMGAFVGCIRLQQVICNAENPPACDLFVFQGLPEGATAFVPPASIDAYKAAFGWKDLLIEPIPEGGVPPLTTPVATTHVAFRTATDGLSIILLEAQGQPLSLYSLTGAIIHRTDLINAARYQIQAPQPGIYILRVGNTTRKVAVQ